MVGELNNWSLDHLVPGWVKVAGSLCIYLVLAQAALAGKSAPYGEYFVRVDERWPDAGGVRSEPEADAGSAAQDNASFQTQLSRLEAQGGPYADGLAEPLADLARLHRRSGDVAQAQQAYQRALHVVRINDGLYSERQVPILRELFETYRMTGDLAALDARYNYFFRLYGNGQPPFTPLRLGAALEYLRWQREALRLELDERDTERVINLYSVNDQLLRSAATDPAVSLESYRGLVLSQLRNLYLIQSRYDPGKESKGVITQVAPSTPWDEQDTSQRRLETYQRNALKYGRVILKDLIHRTPDSDVAGTAAAWLELADWNQWNDRRADALDAYRKVDSLLREAGEEALLAAWLGEPVELPANGAFWQPRPVAVDIEPPVVRARYDVSASGRADNIEVTDVSGVDESKLGRVRRNLAQTRFRPRILDGEPEPQLQLQRDYQVLY